MKPVHVQFEITNVLYRCTDSILTTILTVILFKILIYSWIKKDIKCIGITVILIIECDKLVYACENRTKI